MCEGAGAKEVTLGPSGQMQGQGTTDRYGRMSVESTGRSPEKCTLAEWMALGREHARASEMSH